MSLKMCLLLLRLGTMSAQNEESKELIKAKFYNLNPSCFVLINPTPSPTPGEN